MRLHFDNFDEYRLAAQGWGLDFIQLDAGCLDATLNISQTSNVFLANTSLNRAFYQQGVAPPMGRTFGLYLHPTAEVTWLGQQFEKNTLAVFPADGVYESYSRPGMNVLAITISQQLLEFVAKISGFQDCIENFPEFGKVYTCRSRHISALRETARQFLALDAENQKLSGELESELTRLILQSLSQKDSTQVSINPRKRDRVFKASVELVREQFETHLTISNLCRSVGASERTLRYAFMEKLGVSPKAYLSAVRMTRARSALLTADPACSRVMDIAMDAGFHHMGQFAHDYFSMFGEKPFETLRR